MSKLEEELETLIHSRNGLRNSAGDGELHQQKIDLLKFKITRRDKMNTIVVSALIGATVSAVVTILTKAFG